MQSHLLDPALEEAPSQPDDEYAWADEAEAWAMGYGRQYDAQDPDEYPVVSSYEALEALVAAPPIDDLGFRPAVEPVRLTRQAARRMAMQICDAKLKESGVPRAERRRLLFNKKARIFNFSDLARGLVGLSDTAQT